MQNASLVYVQVQFMDQRGDCGFSDSNTFEPHHSQKKKKKKLKKSKIQTAFHSTTLNTKSTKYIQSPQPHEYCSTHSAFRTPPPHGKPISYPSNTMTNPHLAGAASGCEAGGRCDNIQRIHSERLRGTRWPISERKQHLVHVLVPLHLPQWQPAQKVRT